MAASSFHDTCYENSPITKYSCNVFWSSNPPAISWIIWAHLEADTGIFPVKSIYKKLIPSVSDFFILLILDYFFLSEINLPHINLDLYC